VERKQQVKDRTRAQPGMKAARYGDADHRLTSSGKAVTQRHHLRLWCTVSSVPLWWVFGADSTTTDARRTQRWHREMQI